MIKGIIYESQHPYPDDDGAVGYWEQGEVALDDHEEAKLLAQRLIQAGYEVEIVAKTKEG